MNNLNIPLDEKLANQIGGALHRLQELSEKKIIESGDAAEKRAQTGWLQGVLLAHAPELLGAWFTMNQEYRPLLRSLAIVLDRCGQIIDRTHQIQQQAQQPSPTPKPDEKQPANIIQLPVKE